MMSATRAEAMTCRFRWAVWTQWCTGGKSKWPLTCLLIYEDVSDFWLSFPGRNHPAGESVLTPIRLVTAAEDRVRASQITKSLMLAQCYWLMLLCVSWAADSEAFFFHWSHAVIHRRFTTCEPAVGTLRLENFSFEQVTFFWGVNSDSHFCKITMSKCHHTNLDYC